MSLNEQCSMVQAKIMATRERLRLARLEHHPEERDAEAVGGAPEQQQLEDGAQLSSNSASRPATAELKSACGVDDDAPEEADGAAELLQSSSSSDGGGDSDSEDEGALARAEESLAAAPAAAKTLAPPRELFTFKTEEVLLLL